MQWKRLFTGLAFRISFVVFAATLFTSLVISLVSVHSIGTFLRGELDRKLPDLLERTRTRLELWYEQREREVAAFALSPALLESLGADAERGELSRYLSTLLERSPQYSALILLDFEGEEMARAGAAPELDPALHAALVGSRGAGVSGLRQLEGRQVQIVSAPVAKHPGEPLATLHAVLGLEALEPLLHQPQAPGSTTLQLVDGTGRALGDQAALAPHRVSVEATGSNGAPEIVITESASGERIVAGILQLPHLGWTLLAVERYDAAFAPVGASVRQTLAINLLTVFLSSAGAFALAAWRMRPILALSEGARRISEGETAVEVPDSGSSDEIQILARSFNQMSASLRESRRQLEARNEELQRANEALEQLSITDSLTRLHNHRYFQDQFAREAKRVERSGSPLCLVLIDIDDFKRLNDHLGHAAGDAVLKRIAQVMVGVLRDTDTLCRYGGEEFALLSPQTDLHGATALAEKIRTAVAESNCGVVGPEGPVQITVSIGVAEYARSTDGSFERADRALYQAKAAGKDCVVAAGPPDRRG